MRQINWVLVRKSFVRLFVIAALASFAINGYFASQIKGEDMMIGEVIGVAKVHIDGTNYLLADAVKTRFAREERTYACGEVIDTDDGLKFSVLGTTSSDMPLVSIEPFSVRRLSTRQVGR